MNFKKAFSLIETLAVISIFSVIALVLIFTINSGTKNKALLDKAQANLLHALELARSQASSGAGTTNHGVHIESDKIIVFEGNEYIEGDGREIIFPSSISTDQTGLTIIFERIKALPEIATDAVIILEHLSGVNKIITITQDGRIISQ